MKKYTFYLIWIISFFLGRLTASIYSVNSTKSVNINETKETTHDHSSYDKKVVIREKHDHLGNHTKITTFDLHSNSDIHTSMENAGRVEEDKKVITKHRPGTVNVSALITSSTKGVSVTKELIGPVTVGAFALSDGTLGASLGLNF